MTKVYLHQALRADRLLGHVQADGRVLRNDAGLDDVIGHVDLATGKIFAAKFGPDDYIGNVDLESGAIHLHIPRKADRYLGKVRPDGRMYRHVPAGADEYIGRTDQPTPPVLAGAAFLLLVWPAISEQED
jgi:hypothetical protein